MIIRVFRAKVRPGKGAEFQRLVREQSIPMVKKQAGVVAVYAGSPVGSNRDEFTVTTVWKDLEHLKSFAGGDWEKSVVPPDELPLLEATSIHHFELFHSESNA
jgi:quinol monooxygenase YgiN